MGVPFEVLFQSPTAGNGTWGPFWIVVVPAVSVELGGVLRRSRRWVVIGLLWSLLAGVFGGLAINNSPAAGGGLIGVAGGLSAYPFAAGRTSMAQLLALLTGRAPGCELDAPPITRLVTSIGVLLVPVATFLTVITLVGVWAKFRWIMSYPSYPANSAGITSTRRYFEILLMCGCALAGPLASTFLLLDPLRTGMGRRARLALCGYMGTLVCGLALVVLLLLGALS